jgi:hypothetical protein
MTTTAAGTGWKETIEEGEEAQLVAYAEALREVQRKQAAGGRAARALHAKGTAGVLGELEVLPDVPAHARAGLFASPAKYRAYVRFSNGSHQRQSDNKGDVRGVAVKVVGVAGKKIIPGMEDARTQDFLFIRTPTIPFRDAHEFVSIVTAAAAGQALLVPRAIARLGFGRAFELLPKLAKGLKEPMGSLAMTRWFTAAPIRYGEHAAKLALFPRQSTNGAPAAPPEPRSPDWLGEDLAARLRDGDVAWDLRAQLWVDESRTPIEDPSVEWTEDRAPFFTVARLTLPQQDLSAPRARRVAEYIETLSFDPWHALVEHRPLGGIMRARNHAYRVSTGERKAAAEPDGSEVHE